MPASSRASAASTIGSSCALVPIASRSLSIARSTLDDPMKRLPNPSFKASTHQRCHRKPCRRRVPKSEMTRSGSARSRSTLSHSFALARAYSTSSANRPLSRRPARARSSLTIASAGISHIVVCVHGPAKVSSNCPSTRRSS